VAYSNIPCDAAAVNVDSRCRPDHTDSAPQFIFQPDTHWQFRIACRHKAHARIQHNLERQGGGEHEFDASIYLSRSQPCVFVRTRNLDEARQADPTQTALASLQPVLSSDDRVANPPDESVVYERQRIKEPILGKVSRSDLFFGFDRGRNGYASSQTIGEENGDGIDVQIPGSTIDVVHSHAERKLVLVQGFDAGHD
jgi:hypothetical protein